MKNVILTNPSYTVDHLGDQNYVQDAIAHSGIKRFVVLGILSVALFVGGSAYWAVNSKLEGAVVAPASLVVEGNRKTVEHLEGGIVRNILAVEGQMVEAGQTLLELDSTDLDVNLDVLKSQLGDLVVRRARLLAQIDGADDFSQLQVLETLRMDLPQDAWIGAYSTQKSLFDAELQTLALETALQDQQIEGLRQQISGLMEQRTSNARQLEITNEELGNLETLFERGLVAGTRVTSRRVEIERLNGIDASLRTQEAQIDNQISELMLTNLGEQKLRNETISTELAQIEALLTSLEPQYVGATERLKRIAITAPVSGRVVGMTVFTDGGVIRPGEPILDIVPNDESLVVEARVSTADIEKLFIGQSSRVLLSAFDLGETPEAMGKIVDISADSFEDERTGTSYYIARVELDTEQTQEVAALDLLPGMPADLFVNTGERTALSYLTQPIQARLARTFIE